MSQLELIWNIFGINTPAYPNIRLKGVINTLVDHRNRIAHGEEWPERIGGRYSIGEMHTQSNDVLTQCLYYLNSLEGYLLVATNLHRR
jgi:hypothetical protein